MYRTIAPALIEAANPWLICRSLNQTYGTHLTPRDLAEFPPESIDVALGVQEYISQQRAKEKKGRR